MKELNEEGYSPIILLKDDFPKGTDLHYQYFKLQGVYFEACAEERYVADNGAGSSYTHR